MPDLSDREFIETAIWALRISGGDGSSNITARKLQTAELLEERSSLADAPNVPTVSALRKAQKVAFSKLQELNCEGCDPDVMRSLSDWSVWHNTTIEANENKPEEFHLPFDPKEHPRELEVHLQSVELALIMDSLERAEDTVAGE